MSLNNTNNTNTTKDVVLFEENSILPLPEFSGVFWMVVVEG